MPAMDSDEFRRHAHAIADWVADYLRDVAQRPIVPAARRDASADAGAGA